MNTMLTIAIIIIIIAMAMMTISVTLAKKPINDREKMSPFECGFDPKSSARLPFSLHFFLIAVIFLIFDVEITMLMPMMMMMKTSKMTTLSMMMITFTIILLVGLYHEWNQGSLNWTI